MRTRLANDMSWRAATVLSDEPPVTLDAFLEGKVGRPQPAYPAVSLFSNAGVGDYGYRLAGFTFHVHAEKVASRLELCANNHPRSVHVEGDLNDTWTDVVDSYRDRFDGRPRLLTAMPPCQGMSTGSNSDRAGKMNDDPRNLLSFLVAKVTSRLKPEYVVVENVPGILFTRVRDPDTSRKGTVAGLLRRKMRGYTAYACTIQFADYGIPQRRLRTILTFVRNDSPAIANLALAGRYPFPRPTHSRHGIQGRQPWVTVKDFLERRRLVSLSSAPNGRIRDDEDTLHFVPRLDARRFKWVSAIPPHTGRGAFENGCLACPEQDVPLYRMTCPRCGEALVARPHVVSHGRPRKIVGHHSSYRRMRSNLPATTITTATGHLGSDVNIHPWQNRLLSPRECALIQTIPETFSWDAPHGGVPPVTELREMIGEALPSWYGFLHGIALRVAAGRQGHGNLLAADAAECQRLDLEDLDALQADRRKRLEAARRLRAEMSRAKST